MFLQNASALKCEARTELRPEGLSPAQSPLLALGSPWALAVTRIQTVAGKGKEINTELQNGGELGWGQAGVLNRGLRRGGHRILRRYYQNKGLGKEGCLSPAAERPESSRQRDSPDEASEAGETWAPCYVGFK